MSDDTDTNTPVPTNPPGRPTKFTEDRRDKILTAIRMGHYRNVAAAYAGISYETLRRWLREAENPTADPAYRAFRDDIDVAEAQAEAIDLGFVRQAARDGDWKAAAWRLERAHPDRWGKKDQTEVHVLGQVDHNVEVTVGADPISIGALAQSLANRAAEGASEGAIVDVEVVEASEPGALLPSHGGMPAVARPVLPEAVEVARDGGDEGEIARES